MTEAPPELTPAEATAIANREAFVVPHPLQAAAFVADNDPMVTLRITRMIGGVAREFCMSLQVNRSAEDFTAMSRKVWLLLMQEEAGWSQEQPQPKRARTFGGLHDESYQTEVRPKVRHEDKV